MRKILIIAAAIILILLAFRYCEFKTAETSTIESETGLIRNQLQNVGKLVVTEGHFSEVLTYKDQEKHLLDFISIDKKAILIVNASVTVAYDLRQVKYDIDDKRKTITITNIPEAEIKISPDIRFYDIQQSRINPFNGNDYNKINASVKKRLQEKLGNSTLKTNAENRLISELSKVLILTNTMGWTLIYNGQQVNDQNFESMLKN